MWFACRDVAPKDCMVFGQGARVGHRQPQAHEHSVITCGSIVLESCPAMIDHVVVEELDVSWRKSHLEALFLGNLHQRSDSLAFAVSKLAHTGAQLGIFYISQ